MHSIMLVQAAQTITGTGNSIVKVLSQVGGGLLIVFLGYKALGHIAQDQFGRAIGLVVIAIIPALFLLAPSTAESLLKGTINSIT